jgi:hypothetical protein
VVAPSGASKPEVADQTIKGNGGLLLLSELMELELSHLNITGNVLNLLAEGRVTGPRPLEGVTINACPNIPELTCASFLFWCGAALRQLDLRSLPKLTALTLAVVRTSTKHPYIGI